MTRRSAILFVILISGLLFSCKTAKLSDAVEKQEKGEYFDAAQIYRKVYSKTSSKKTYLRGSVAFHMAECYREISNTQRAVTAYQNAIRYQYEDSMALLYSAQMLHKLGRYAEAKKQYQAFLQQKPDDIVATNGIIGCDSAASWKKNPTRYIVKKMDKMNSRYGEFSPMLTGESFDMLYFTSARKEATGDTKSAITGGKNNDFFVVKQDERKAWMKPEVLEEGGVNTDFDEGTCSFTSDGSTMYYTYCPEDVEAPRTAQIYKSSRSGAQWSAGRRVEIFKDTLTMSAHPAVGSDGFLYFVSDAPGGQGGKDLWRVPIDGIGVTFPENLGPEINTPGDEMFPFMTEDSVLYFSSNGHPGMGGLDIFKANKSKNGHWKIENLKAPVNSMADDFGITLAGKEIRGFFSSNRGDAKGLDHIYSLELPATKLLVEGWVLDKEEELIDGAMVRVVGKDGTNDLIYVRKDGTYQYDASPGVEYVMMGTAKGYLNQKQTITIPIQEKSEAFYVDFYLASISKPVLVENIFYEFDKATLTPDSKEALDGLIAMLNDNPNITIELSAHTDRKGSDEYNQKLSLRRAQSVVDYLIQGGIEKERLTPAGYGKLQPKVVTKNIARQYDFLPEGQILDEVFIETLTPQQQEVADQTNRRTEFKVLRTNYRLF